MSPLAAIQCMLCARHARDRRRHRRAAPWDVGAQLGALLRRRRGWDAGSGRGGGRCRAPCSTRAAGHRRTIWLQAPFKHSSPWTPPSS